MGVAERIVDRYANWLQHIVSYPISQGRLVNLVAFVTIPGGEGQELKGPAVIDVPKDEVLEYYKGWEPAMEQLLDVSGVGMTLRC